VKVEHSKLVMVQMTEKEAGQLLAILNGIYQTPDGIGELETELTNLNIAQVGSLTRDGDDDVIWEA
jgi:hypothetical protein